MIIMISHTSQGEFPGTNFMSLTEKINKQKFDLPQYFTDFWFNTLIFCKLLQVAKNTRCPLSWFRTKLEGLYIKFCQKITSNLFFNWFRTTMFSSGCQFQTTTRRNLLKNKSENFLFEFLFRRFSLLIEAWNLAS